MRRAIRLGCLLVVLFCAAGRADLARDIEVVLKDRQLQNVTVGIEIVRLGHSESESKEIYQHESRTPLTPASNLKLTTTSAAWIVLAPHSNFKPLSISTIQT